MNTPIRSSIFAVTELPEEKAIDMTLRQALEWYKKVVGAIPFQLSAMEHKEVDGAWGGLVGAIAKREGIPAGSLSYFLGELAQTEMRLEETVATEAHEAGIDYVPE